MSKPKPEPPRLIVGASCSICQHKYEAMTGVELTAEHGKHCIEAHVGMGSVPVRIRASAGSHVKHNLE